tara:strand:+ start:747 stop:1190 length:444 start_codon:yes stop_codon:yes gene_type:complete
MATTTLTLGITSDISSNALDISTSMTVTTDGSSGVTETSGIARKIIGATDTILIDISAEPVTLIAKKAVLYIKNCDSTFTDYVDLKIGTAPTADQHAEVLRIYGGQFAVLPLVNSTSIDADGGIDGDVMVKAASASTLIEYALFYEA